MVLVLLGATQLPGVCRGDLCCAQVHPTYRVLMPVTLVRTRLHDILTYYRLEDFCVTAGLESAVSRMLQNAGIPFNKAALARAARTLDPGRCETERWPVCACSPVVDATASLAGKNVLYATNTISAFPLPPLSVGGLGWPGCCAESCAA